VIPGRVPFIQESDALVICDRREEIRHFRDGVKQITVESGETFPIEMSIGKRHNELCL
jgi:hypothetical protein